MLTRQEIDELAKLHVKHHKFLKSMSEFFDSVYSLIGEKTGAEKINELEKISFELCDCASKKFHLYR